MPYTSYSQAVTDMISGRISLWITTLGGAVGNIQAGKMRALAVTGNTRMPALPGVPTVQEALGLADFDVRTWFGLAAPAGVPRAIIDRLNAEVRRAAAVPEVRARLEQIGGEVRPSTPQEFRDRIARELAMWIKVVDEAKLPKQ